MILGRRLAKKELVREIRAAPDRIAGRGGAVRIRTGGMELAPVCFYSSNEWKRRKDENPEGGECRGNDVGRLPDERMATQSPSSGGRRRKHVDWMKK